MGNLFKIQGKELKLTFLDYIKYFIFPKKRFAKKMLINRGVEIIKDKFDI